MSENTEQPVSPVDTQYASIEKEYERKVFWTKIFPVLRKGGLFVWSVVDLILVFGILLFFVWYLVQGVFEERQLVARIGQNSASQRAVVSDQRAGGLIVSNAQVLPGAEGRHDLYAQVSNPNEDWLVRFSYHFATSLGNTAPRAGYVLPGQSQEIVELSSEWDTRPGNAELVLEQIAWERVRDIPNGDVEAWIAERQDFAITDVEHGVITTIGDRNVIQTSFTIENQSPYSYWDMDVAILLKVGNSVVGVNQIRIPYIDTAETISRTVNWFWIPSTGAIPEIIPQLNYFNDEIYRGSPSKPSGELREGL